MDPYDELALDLLGRIQRTLANLVQLAADTGIPFTLDDVTETVERGLPDDYLMPPHTEPPRPVFIRRIAATLLDGAMTND
ncbi:hypothetical protein ACN6K5_000910 [Streptomyces violaceoruber]|uniref:hypothetical protein n=1 Tax=Streptomyces violaceoruber TaxID=1935 RepID=UPI00403CAF99